MKVLVIDDLPEALALAAILVKRLGHEAYLATTGESGEDLAWQERPDLILLDVWMPSQDGMETLMKLRKWYRGKIIMVTALKSQDKRHNALVLGADDYWDKPFTSAMLARALSEAKTQ